MIEPVSRISRSLSHDTSVHHLCNASYHGFSSGSPNSEITYSLTLEQQGSSPESPNNEMMDFLTSGEQFSSSILHNLDHHSSSVVPLLADAEHQISGWISSNSRGSAPFDQYENHRDHTTTPLSITYSQWVSRANPLTTMRVTHTV